MVYAQKKKETDWYDKILILIKMGRRIPYEKKMRMETLFGGSSC